MSLAWKYSLVLSLVLALLAALASGVASAKVLKIGIAQIVEHPSLDAARQGFIDRLQELGYEQGRQVTYDLRNAQGDMATAQTIAQKFVADKVDIILAIATPTAQAAANATTRLPILITAVTDPQAAGLVQANDRPATNVTGTSDLNPVAEQLGLVKQLDAKAHRVGVLYNAGETNSLVQVDLARKAAQNLGLTLVEATVSSSNEVLQAAQSLLNRVDAIYVPTDNTVVSALESVIMVAERGKLPLVVGEGDSVRRGGLISVGIDYYRLGRQTADMAVAVINGSDPASMPIQYQKELLLTINLRAAKAMGVQVPQALLTGADEVIH